MNFQANMLMLHERDEIRASTECRDRVKKSYALFLDFLGIALVDEDTGAVERTPGFAARFENLRTRGHNFLRITRVLKFLGEVGSVPRDNQAAIRLEWRISVGSSLTAHIQTLRFVQTN